MSVEILKFSAEWCMPCKQLATTFEQAKLEIPVKDINIDVDAEMVSKFNIRGVPTLVLMQNEQEVARTSGYKNVSQLKAFIDANI